MYLYKKRGLQKPLIEPVGRKTYMLIRIGLDVGENEWFGQKLAGQSGEKKAAGAAQEIDPNSQRGDDSHADSRVDGCDSRHTRQGPVRALLHPVKTWKEARRQKELLRAEEERRYTEEQEKQRIAEEREERIRSVRRAIGTLFAETMELAGERRDCFCVYEDSVRKFLTRGRGSREGESGRSFVPAEERAYHESRGDVLLSLWQRCFEAGEFNGYCRKFWVEELLLQAKWPHFILLGTASCIFSVLEEQADRMKSLRWIVPEKDCSQELLAFVEDFYTEYGLAIDFQPLTSPVMPRRLRISCDLPANILDFTMEPSIGIADIAEGSVWLDMQSVEEKRRRIVERASGIQYFSLKERWKTAERRCKPPVLP